MDDAAREEFMQLLIQNQTRVRTFVQSLVPDPHQAEDVVQEVNLGLWRKADEFELGTNFAAWACRVAYLQVLAHRKRLSRAAQRFSDALVSELADVAQQRLQALDERREALRLCLGKLPRAQRLLLEKRYDVNMSLQEMAAEQHRSVPSVKQALYRVRRDLLDCIRRRLAQWQSSND